MKVNEPKALDKQEIGIGDVVVLDDGNAFLVSHYAIGKYALINLSEYSSGTATGTHETLHELLNSLEDPKIPAIRTVYSSKEYTLNILPKPRNKE